LTLVGAALMQQTMPGMGFQVISSAEAIVGRPLTPVSYAGVARRTTRRTVAYTGAATAAAVGTAAVVGTAAAAGAAAAQAPPPPPPASNLVASLPPGCPAMGANFVCGGYSYHPMLQGSTVVYAVQPE
jgi:hypothetical protein